LLGALDFGFLALAAPAVATDLGLGATTYGWLFTAGALAYGAVVLPSTALLGHVAPSRLLAAGLTIAAVGVTTLALAEGPAAALGARVLFGAGGGMAAGPALILLAEEEADGRDGAFAHMGGAIAIGFSSGVLLGTSSAWRGSLVAVFALLAAVITATVRLPAERRHPPRAAAGAVRLGAATAATGAFLAALPAEPLLAGAIFVAAAGLGLSGWAAVRAGLPASRGGLAVACAAGAATTMSGVGATVLLGQHLGGSGSLTDGLTLAAFGVGTLPGVFAARALGLRRGATATAVVGLLMQAVALLLVAPALGAAPALAPAVALFGAGHVVANAGSAGAVMQAAGDSAAGLFVTCQYIAAGLGPLVVLGVAGARGQAAGMILAAVIALGAAAVAGGAQRLAPTHSASRSA
jgi:predicted MFS family arabinose efflux permease